jgi:hypothetical protein
VDCLYFPGVKKVAREQGYYEEDDEDGQRPGCEYLFLASFGLLCSAALELGREHGSGLGLTIGVCVDNIALCGGGHVSVCSRLQWLAQWVLGAY